jgi:RNA polymerase sigma-70 factor (sigma-E family)
LDWDEDFSEYMRARWSSLVRAAVLMGSRPHDAEDLVQRTLERCYASWPRIQRAGNRDAYVYRSLINALAESRRRLWWGERPTATLPEQSADVDQAGSVDIADAVDRALRSLSDVNRKVVVLRYFASLTERETAETLDIAAGTVKSRLSRALSQLSTNDHLLGLVDGVIDE